MSAGRRGNQPAAGGARGERGEFRLSERRNVGVSLTTPWGEASELRARRLYPGAGTPASEVTRNQREALLKVADRLCAELGYAEGGGETREARALADGESAAMAGMLGREDEMLVRSVRWSLAKLAVAVAAANAPVGAPKSAVRVALDGAELVMRGELIRGNGTRLGALMPSFVFLVTLPIVHQDEALDLSRRTAELIEGALGA